MTACNVGQLAPWPGRYMIDYSDKYHVHIQVDASLYSTIIRASIPD